MNGPSVGTPVEPCDFTVFGGTGDLALRKLLPALYLRDRDGQLPDGFRIIGVSRADVDDDGYRAMVEGALAEHVARDELADDVVRRLLGRLHHVTLDVEDVGAWHRLHDRLKDGAAGEDVIRVFYLAVAPALFGPICEHLDQVGLATDRSRVVLEKPIGTDLATAETVNEAVGRVFDESHIFRIDHYLGKESVQNLLVTRFANTFLEPLWNSHWVDHVQITVSESLGVGERGSYYDRSGALRDMVQNHLLQLVCLVAMEPPTYVDRETVRDEKLKVLQALRPLTPELVDRDVVAGQYAAGPLRRASRRRRTPTRSATRAAPRPSWRSRPRCRTGAGPACRSTCGPASGWRSGSRRSSWSSRSRRTRCSRTARAPPSPTGCTSASSPTRACACT